MKRLFGTRRRKIAAVAVVAALAIAGGAAAYFLSTGSGSTTATVGTAGTLSVSVTDGGTVLYPGGASDSYTATATNNSTGDLATGTSNTASLATDGSGDLLKPGGASSYTGCKASWFTVVAPTNQASPVSIAANGGSHTFTGGSVTLTETGTDQSACENATPTVNVTIG